MADLNWTTIPDDSRKFVEKNANCTDVELNKLISQLASVLGGYGFEGTVRLNLTVTIQGRKNTVFERTNTVPFEHR